MFETPYRLSDNPYQAYIAGPESCNLLPASLRHKALFIAPTGILKNYYPLSFGDYLGEPFNREDFEYRISQLCLNEQGNPYIKQYRFLFSHTEYLILKILTKDPGRIYSPAELISTLSCGNIKNLRQLVYTVRIKLNRLNGISGDSIRTVKNMGYQWIN